MMKRLPAGKPIGPGLLRIAARLVQEAAHGLGAHPEPAAETVHAARVALKRARSTLRLLEKAGADWARMPRLRLAALARGLSAARESAVAAELATRLHRRTRHSRRELAARLLRSMSPARVVDPAGICAALRREAAMLACAPLPRIKREALGSSLRRSLERVSGCHHEAATRPGHDRIHEWRKRVIVLRDQTGLAAATWPAGAGRAHRMLVPLARELGFIGDIMLLEARFRRLAVPRALRGSRRKLLAGLRAGRTKRTARLIRRWPVLAGKLGRLLAIPGPS